MLQQLSLKAGQVPTGKPSSRPPAALLLLAASLLPTSLKLRVWKIVTAGRWQQQPCLLRDLCQVRASWCPMHEADRLRIVPVCCRGVSHGCNPRILIGLYEALTPLDEPMLAYTCTCMRVMYTPPFLHGGAECSGCTCWYACIEPLGH